MCRVAYIDDDYSTYLDYQKRLKRKNIELLFVDNCTSLEDIVEWILENSIECVLVDHKLTARYSFRGTNVVAYINNQLPDLPCIILTGYPEDSKEDNLVMTRLILDKSIMHQDDINIIVDIIKQSVEVFRNRLKMHMNEYISLIEKKENSRISAFEEERYLHLYRLLRAYGEVDKIPTEFLKPDIEKRIKELIEKIDYYIDIKKK